MRSDAAAAGLLVAACALGCRGSASGSAPSAGASSSASVAPAAVASAASTAALPADAEVPVVVDPGRGRATAALRAALQAFRVDYEPNALLVACKVGDDGASIDDLEEAARGRGLEATQVMLPVEHVATSSVLPAIVVLDAVPRDGHAAVFVLAWRLVGDEVEIMHPASGRQRLSRSDFERALHPHTMPIDATALRDAFASPGFQAELFARMGRVGVEAAKARALLAEANGDPGFGGVAALDATTRAFASPTQRPAAPFDAVVACARGGPCAGGALPPAQPYWTARGAPGPENRVIMRGTVALTLAAPGTTAAPRP